MGSQSAGIGSALPDQTDQSGKVLVTDGVMASWASPDTAALPVQTGHGGEFLTTDGTDPSWVAVTAGSLLPDQTAHAGDVLSTDGAGALSWIAASGVSLGAFSSTPSTDGLTLAANTLNLDPADGTHPGGVSTTTQTFAGVKTFGSVPVAAGISAPTTSGFTLSGNVTTGASAVGVTIDNLVNLTTAGAKIVSFQNHEVEKTFIDKDGVIDTIGRVIVEMSAATDIVNGTSGNSVQLCSAASGAAMGVGLATVGNAHMLLQTDGSYVQLRAPSGLVYLVSSGSGIAVFGSGTADLTGLGNGGSIKLKSPDGTTYTASIANGGTWNIA